MRFIPVIYLVVMAALSACSEDKNDTKHADIEPIYDKNFNFYKSNALFAEAIENRSETFSEPFELISVTRDSNNLYIELAYSGSCDTNSFDIIWDGLVMESWPCQIQLLVRRTAANCRDTGELHEVTLTVDLAKLTGDEVLAGQTIFHVANGSKTNGESGDNATVSTIK